jgi:hypothetical protein
MEHGENAEAAQIFERLAYGARDIGMENRAPNLLMKGALAYFLSGELEAGKKLLFDGLSLLEQGGLWDHLRRVGSRAVSALHSAGLDQPAQDVQAWLDRALVGKDAVSSEEHNFTTRKLPTTCPGCGAVVRPDEVEWFDPDTAVCAYCGIQLEAG